MTLFLSHSSSDADVVRSLVADLEASGRQIWLDQDLVGGDAWWGRILKEIRECDVFLFAVSPNSLASEPCSAEFEYAKALGLPMLSIEIADIPNEERRNYAVYAEQIVDYRNPTAMTAMSLVRALNEREAARKPLPDPLPPEPAMPYGYLLNLGSVIRGRDPIGYADQHAILGQLRAALRAERNASVRLSIRSLILSLRDRADSAYTIVVEIDSFLGETETEPGATGAAPEAATGTDSALRSEPGPVAETASGPARETPGAKIPGSASEWAKSRGPAAPTADRPLDSRHPSTPLSDAPSPPSSDAEAQTPAAEHADPGQPDVPRAVAPRADAPRAPNSRARATRRLLMIIGAISIATGVAYLILHLGADYHSDYGYSVWPEVPEPTLRTLYDLPLAGLIIALGFRTARTRIEQVMCLAIGGASAAWAFVHVVARLTGNWELIQTVWALSWIPYAAMGVLSFWLFRGYLPMRWRVAVAAAWLVAGAIFAVVWLIGGVLDPYAELPYIALWGLPELIIGAAVLPAAFKVGIPDVSDTQVGDGGDHPSGSEDVPAHPTTPAT